MSLVTWVVINSLYVWRAYFDLHDRYWGYVVLSALTMSVCSRIWIWIYIWIWSWVWISVWIIYGLDLKWSLVFNRQLRCESGIPNDSVLSRNDKHNIVNGLLNLTANMVTTLFLVHSRDLNYSSYMLLTFSRHHHHQLQHRLTSACTYVCNSFYQAFCRSDELFGFNCTEYTLYCCY